MTKMDNGAGTNATGTNPWMAGPLVANIIKFYEQDQLIEAAHKGTGSGISYPVLQDMLLQCQNYIVKYGYDAKKKYFVYSEVTRDTDGGDHLILYGLAYLDRMYQQLVAAGTLPHKEWYDTEALWGPINNARYSDLRTDMQTDISTSLGFYGYELIYPMDFFKIMREVIGQ
jgi:hypothetical protein